MVTIPLGFGDWESTTQDVSRLKMHNMYAVSNPSSPDEASRVSRPTLTSLSTVGAGPIYKMWQQDNTFNKDGLVFSGEEIYRLYVDGSSILVGSIPGSDIPQIAATTDIAVIAREGFLYWTDGVTINSITVPDDAPVSSVATINGYFLLTIKDTQVFYWIEPGEVTIDPLNFASAERIPDPIISVAVTSDEVWFIGGTGPEVWTATGELAAPFQRVSGRVYAEGCFSKDTVLSISVNSLPALFWVTDTKAVVKAQGQPQKVSNESVEEILKTSDDLSAWGFRYNRHDFYVISSPLFTLVYDITSGFWSKWDTYNLPYWVAQTGFQKVSTVFVGDVDTNKIYTLEEGIGDDTLPVIREVSGFLGNSSKAVKCYEVTAYVNSGWSPSYTLEPTLEMRWSDDLGTTWSDYVSASLGQRGDYRRVISYRSLGLIRSPGRVFEFRIADFCRFRIDYVTMNERLG